MAKIGCPVTIVICYQKGTQGMLSICLDAIVKHTIVPYKILLVTQENGGTELEALSQHYSFETFITNPSSEEEKRLLKMKPHGQMLDMALGMVDTKYLLTLDSDCFPVADGWLGKLLEMMSPDVACSGILHPWEPPPEDLSATGIR